jgi:hypothetical protein
MLYQPPADRAWGPDTPAAGATGRHTDDQPVAGELARLARRLLKLATLRDRYLQGIGEPAFNMLLDLLVQSEKEPTGFAFRRWDRSPAFPRVRRCAPIRQLKREGMATISEGQGDRRRRWVHLSRPATNAVLVYLEAAKTAYGA